MKIRSIILIILFAVVSTLKISAYDKQEFLKHAKAIPNLMTQLSEAQIDEIIYQGEDAANDYLLTKISEYMLQEFPNLKSSTKLNYKGMDEILFNKKKDKEGLKYEKVYTFILPFLNYMNIDECFEDANRIGWGIGIDIFNDPSFQKVMEKQIKSKNIQDNIDELTNALKEINQNIVLKSIPDLPYLKASLKEDKDYYILTLNLALGNKTEKFYFTKEDKDLIVRRTNGLSEILPSYLSIKTINTIYNVEEPVIGGKKLNDLNLNISSQISPIDYKIKDFPITIRMNLANDFADNILLSCLAKERENLSVASGAYKPIVDLYLNVNGFHYKYDNDGYDYKGEKSNILRNSEYTAIFDDGDIQDAYLDKNDLIRFPWLENKINEELMLIAQEDAKKKAEADRRQKEYEKEQREKKAKKDAEKKAHLDKLIKLCNESNYVGMTIYDLESLENSGYIKVDGYDMKVGSTGGYITVINKKGVRTRIRFKYGKVIGQRIF